MRQYLDCVPCYFRQAIQAGRLAGADDALIRRILEEIGALLPDIPDDSTPPYMASMIHRRIRELTGVTDPYHERKRESTGLALRMMPDIRRIIDEAPDPLFMAVKAAIAGNIIDYGVKGIIDIEREVLEIMNHDLAIDDFEALRSALEDADDILYLADNTGETVFDRLLIERLDGRKITYAVRSIPILNDATVEDAMDVGIDKVVKEIVPSGCEAPGTVLDQCSDDFRARFRDASLIISKGQGNYESISDETRGGIFFLLQAKCAVIASDIGVDIGGLILMENNPVMES